jgi:hypothetical protein
LCKQTQMFTFCTVYSKFCANHDNVCGGAARHARDI